MKDQDFSDFLESLGEDTYSEFPLTLTKDHFALRPDQWKMVEGAVKKNCFTALDISESQISSMSPQMWEQIFNVVKAGNCKSLSISIDQTFKDLDRAQWNSFFEQMSRTAIKKFILFQVDSHKMKPDVLKLFLQRLSTSHIEAFQVYGLDFAYASRKYCQLFFEELSKCPRIKKFSIKNYAWLSTEGPFWEVFSEHLPALGMIELGLESIGINTMPESIWLRVCDSLQQSSVTSLSLAGTKFHNFSPEKWNLVFEGLAKTHVVKLNVETFHPMQLSEETWKVFKQGLESTGITALQYEKNQFTEEQKMDINQILSSNAKKNLGRSLDRQTSVQTVSDSTMEDVAPSSEPLTFSYNLRGRGTKSRTSAHGLMFSEKDGKIMVKSSKILSKPVLGKGVIREPLIPLRDSQGDSQQKKRKASIDSSMIHDENRPNIDLGTRPSKRKNK
ncbi:MAG: hypothetical protein KBD23_00645 [Gammaproteobacteria bacterium]|nr:hypothetical protein [Gammaproteobacteria bacterium]